MKRTIKYLGLLFAGSLQINAQTLSLADGPNAPQARQIGENGAITPGVIVPERIGFSLSDSEPSALLPQVDSQGFNFRLTDRTQFNYGDFPGEIVLSVYHTPW